MPTPADYRLMTEATGQRIAAALEALSGTGAAAAAARQNLDVYSTSETDALIQQSTAITSYTGSNGLIVYRAGKLAQIAAYGTNVTTAGTGGDIVATITDAAFRPASRIWQAAEVFDGSNYVDCNVEINTSGQISIRRADNAVIAGYQPQYLKLVGLTYICNGA